MLPTTSAAAQDLQKYRSPTASRMCSHGSSGVVQIAEETPHLIAERFQCVPRRLIDVKGKGGMNVWHVLKAR
jgi:hypothetical protein